MKKYLLGLGVFVFAFAILFVSIFESSSVSYSYAPFKQPSVSNSAEGIPSINYKFQYAGTVLPDNPFWGLKALRDKIWYALTPSPLKKAELALLFSDKRLIYAETLFEEGKPDIAMSTLTKGEKYLEVAVNEESLAGTQGYDTSAFLNKLATASLKHREVIENLMPIIPEDGRPLVVKTEDYARNAYKAAKNGLNSKGLPVPINPFDGD